MGLGSPISLGTLFGMHVRVELSMLLVAAYLTFSGLNGDATSQDLLDQLTYVVLLFVSIFLHELGHAAAAALFKIRTLNVTLTFFGGYAQLATQPRGKLQEVAVSGAGPATNLAVAGLLYLWLYSEQGITLTAHSWLILDSVAYVNWMLGLLNLLPGHPLDGGHIARAILANFMANNQARLIIGYLGVVVGLVWIGLALQSGSIGFGVLVGALLILAATVEIQQARSSRF